MASAHSYLSLFFCFLRLGCTAFGGPVAHIAYFREEFVEKQKLLSEHEYTTLVSLCQFLPGPASSQVGIALGLNKAGQLGAIIAWFAFTLPSAIILILFALSVQTLDSTLVDNLTHGLKIAAIAIVIHALWQMSKSFCQTKTSVLIMLGATVIMTSYHSIWLQFLVISLAGVIGVFAFKSHPQSAHNQLNISISAKAAHISLTLLIIGLIALPLLAAQSQSGLIQLVDSFFRIGASVFGGGHVVLPMLENEVVSSGWVNEQNFLAGYGATQAVPGPIFTFSAFLGAVNELGITPLIGAISCLIAIFLPSFLLVNISLYYWQFCQENRNLKNALTGINAAVVGLLLSYLYQFISSSITENKQDIGLIVLISLLVFSKKFPVWLIVILCGGLAMWVY
ncbi:chromate efflux transporter [Catenovulum adriaticum]|uniref:Chromate efflux transporter n=1 Tax=Catenovulum adriaticum TaxID=2984846 RepID=A0ABY7ANW9_9ALTE|nr:chromate efflux transporter [Catenovulum sp. TS8]WAJ70351.1 chromate efflux transporter [Catenovulum sp. TS8]